MTDLTFFESKIADIRALKTRRKIFGVGINDAPFCTQFHDGNKLIAHPAYVSWKSMITRCYDKKYQDKYPTYKNKTVCDEWLSFMRFRSWWISNHVYGWHLDKDILTDSDCYSPDACIFIPSHINIFLTDSASNRGDHAIGASMTRYGLFNSSCQNPVSKKKEHLGNYATENEAHLAWRNRKLEIALELKPQMDAIDLRIYPRVVTIINSKR